MSENPSSESNIDIAMQDVYQALASKIQELHRSRESTSQLFLIGLAGPPGAGKTTTASALCSLIPRSIVVPMDGYHYSKAQLREFSNPEEAFARRGAEWTFDGESFVKDLRKLKSFGFGSFPSFDHAVGDPIEKAIVVSYQDIDVVIVEGNYLLLPEEPWSQLKENNILDYSIFIRAELETVNDRVYKRHIAVGSSPDIARHRVDNNDSINAIKILASACRADIIVDSK